LDLGLKDERGACLLQYLERNLGVGVEWEKLDEERAKVEEYFPAINISAGRWEILWRFGVVWGEYFPLGWWGNWARLEVGMRGLRGAEGKAKGTGVLRSTKK
jgi:hypothetical protein